MECVKIHPMQFTFMDLKHSNYGFMIRNNDQRSIYYGNTDLPKDPLDLIHLALEKGDDNAQSMILTAYQTRQPIEVGAIDEDKDQMSYNVEHRQYAKVVELVHPELKPKTHGKAKIIDVKSLYTTV